MAKTRLNPLNDLGSFMDKCRQVCQRVVILSIDFDQSLLLMTRGVLRGKMALKLYFLPMESQVLKSRHFKSVLETSALPPLEMNVLVAIVTMNHQVIHCNCAMCD